MDHRGKLPVGEVAGAAYEFLFQNFVRSIPALLVLLVVNIAVAYMFYRTLEPIVAAAGAFSPAHLVRLLGWFIMYLAQIAVTAMLIRLAVTGESSGFFGLQLGGDEFRLLAANVLLALLVGIIVLVGFFLLGAFGLGALASAAEGVLDETAIANLLQTPAGLILMGLLIAGFVALMWAGLRLTCFSGATVMEGRIMVFQTWSWTKGNVWRILAVFLIVMVPINFGILLIAASIGAALGVTGDPVLEQWSLNQYLAQALLQSVISAPVIVAQGGLMGLLYKGFSPSGDVTISDTFE